MRFMENVSDSTASTSSGPATNTTPLPRSSTSLDESYHHISAEEAHITPDSMPNPSVPADAGTNADSAATERKARLLYCKSHVSIHPTNFSKDNIQGYLGIVELDTAGTGNNVDREGNVKGAGRKETLVTWVPDELLQRMDERDREGYKRVEARGDAPVPEEEDGFVFVSIPPPRGEKYAFSVPVSTIYSILVYPPSLSHWYGSATFNLTGGVSLPTLYFHDDESPLLASAPTVGQTPKPRSQWGFPPFISLLGTRATLLRSRLLTPRQNHGAELWLINPSKSDRDVHEAGVDEQPSPLLPSPTQATDRRASTSSTGRTSGERRRSSIPVGLFGAAIVPNYGNYPPEPQFPNSPFSGGSPKQSLLMGLSGITNLARRAAKEVLNTPLAQPVVPHLPPAMRSLVNAQGEWEAGAPGAKGRGKKRASDVAGEFESARLYLARWARVVAEEGERARRQEVAARSAAGGASGEGEGEDTGLGMFSLLSSPNAKGPAPRPTRVPENPISARDWDSFAAQGRDEHFVRREIFRRGFSASSDAESKRARREGWEVLLGVLSWSEGRLGGGEAGMRTRREKREQARNAKREEYERIKAAWMDVVRVAAAPDGQAQAPESDAGEQGSAKLAAQAKAEGWKEEWHRIDVDCRRTDRNQAIYAVPPGVKDKGDEEKEGGGVPAGYAEAFGLGKGREEEEGSAAALNKNIAALRVVLMTYHTYAPDLGYVQGMSDLLSPIYVVFEANEADAFWGLVGVMKMMESNFLRDQSGMKRQLSTLQKLIGVMDPELYAHLDRTDSLNLFFCFRWILISFKREFAFDQVIRLWEVLWTDFYSRQFTLFVALAILHSHREVLMRYLREFDEVLKYANDLSGTIDLDSTLAQAEVLFLQFRQMVTDADVDGAGVESSGAAGLRKRTARVSEGSGAGDNGGAEGVDEAALAQKQKERKEAIDSLRELVRGWGEGEGEVDELQRGLEGVRV